MGFSAVVSPAVESGSAAAIARVRAGRPDDLDGLLALAEAGGTGLTNLPPDAEVLTRKLQSSVAALSDPAARQAGAPILLITELNGRTVGTGCVFPRVGADWPFCSYRITRQAQTSRALKRATAQRLLNLVHDFDGEVEVGGLFVHPQARGAYVGALTARSRYLFLAQHRDWFGRRVMAELRGWQDDLGRSPVWEALGRHFYDMDFEEADRLNAVAGNQFIADLGPRYPIYISILPKAAQAALGRPHDDGRRALSMLMEEGFRDEEYVDIFDGGPTVFADIDDLRTVRESAVAGVEQAQDLDPARRRLVAAGSGPSFRAAIVAAAPGSHGGLRIGREAMAALDLRARDSVRHAPADLRAYPEDRS